MKSRYACAFTLTDRRDDNVMVVIVELVFYYVAIIMAL